MPIFYDTQLRNVVDVDRKRVITIDEFTEWIRGFGKNKDGQITRDELREAIRATRAWFSYWKAER